MKTSTLKNTLRFDWERGFQVLVKSPPGMGKTAIAVQVAAELHRTGRTFLGAPEPGFRALFTHPAVEEPTDYKGFPCKADSGDHATFLPCGTIWDAIQSRMATVIVMDDFGQAAEAVQKAVMQPLWGRRINGHTIPPWVFFAAFTNDVGQKSGVNGIIEPVKNRFHAIYSVEFDLDGWSEWALDHNVHPMIVAFHNSPQAILPDGGHVLRSWKPSREIAAQSTPRTWELFGLRYRAHLDAGLVPREHIEEYAAAVGEGAGAAFFTFELAATCPSVREILMDPDNAPVPDAPALRYLQALQFAQSLTKGNWDGAIQYLNRLPQPLRFIAIRGALRRQRKATEDKQLLGADAITTSAGYQRWALTEGKAINE